MPPLPKGPLLPIASVIEQARDDLVGLDGKRLSYDDLAYVIRERAGKKITGGALGQIVAGKIRPKISTVLAIAAVAGVNRDTIAEYRLAMAREKLDEGPDAARLEAALENLAVFEAALQRATRRASDAPAPAPPGELGRRAASSTRKKPGREPPQNQRVRDSSGGDRG